MHTLTHTTHCYITAAEAMYRNVLNWLMWCHGKFSNCISNCVRHLKCEYVLFLYEMCCSIWWWDCSWNALGCNSYSLCLQRTTHSLPMLAVRENNKMKKTATTKNDAEAIAFSRSWNYTTPYTSSHVHTTIKHVAADLRKWRVHYVWACVCMLVFHSSGKIIFNDCISCTYK